MEQETSADEVGRAAHDLNNLCAHLMGFASLAQERERDAVVLEYLDEISTSAAAVAALAQHLRAIAQRLRGADDL